MFMELFWKGIPCLINIFEDIRFYTFYSFLQMLVVTYPILRSFPGTCGLNHYNKLSSICTCYETNSESKF